MRRFCPAVVLTECMLFEFGIFPVNFEEIKTKTSKNMEKIKLCELS